MPVTPINLLIVNPEMAMRSLYSRIFTGLGHQVRCAKSNFLALSQVHRDLPQAMLTDADQPELPGFEDPLVSSTHRPAIHVVATGAPSHETGRQSTYFTGEYNYQAINIAYLIRMINSGIFPEQLVTAPSRPVWISPRLVPKPETNAPQIDCPECRQPSPLTIVNSSSLIHESCCIHCVVALYFILVYPAYCTLPVPSYQFSRIAALNNRSLTASPMPSEAGTGQTITVAPRASSSRSPANSLDANDAVSVHSPQR